MEEDIEILKKFVKVGRYNINVMERDTLGKWTDPTSYKKLIDATENLIKEYKLEKLKNVLDEQSLKETLEDYIPKSKIKEKIEELENKPVCLCTRSNGKNDEALQHFINNTVVKLLQELMEDK